MCKCFCCVADVKPPESWRRYATRDMMIRTVVWSNRKNGTIQKQDKRLCLHAHGPNSVPKISSAVCIIIYNTVGMYLTTKCSFADQHDETRWKVDKSTTALLSADVVVEAKIDSRPHLQEASFFPSVRSRSSRFALLRTLLPGGTLATVDRSLL